MNADARTEQSTTTIPASSSKGKKKFEAIVEGVLNQAIADGFLPDGSDSTDHPRSAVTEAARRLRRNPLDIRKMLEAGRITQVPENYQTKDPLHAYLEAMRNAGIEITSDHASRRHAQRLTDEAHRLRQTIKQIDREQLTTDEIRSKIYRLSATSPQVPDWVIEPKLKAGSPGVPITLWSDWHYGEVVSAEQMSGMNEYNLAIADQRIERLTERVINITKHHQVNPEYPGIIVCLGGDMFSGDDLHEELTDTNEVKTLEAFTRLQGRLIWALRKMADEFGHVHVPCIMGNHGRTSKKPRFKLRAETNFEFLLYTQLEFFFQNDPQYRDKVTFQTTRESGVHFTVGSDPKTGRKGHRYYLVHGDVLGVKGGDGIIGAIGPIKRGHIKVGRSEASIGRDFDTLLMGHWHQYIPMPGVVVNGTLKGWDEYARLALAAPFDPPSQALWFNHPDYGPVTHHKIILDPPGHDYEPQEIVVFPTVRRPPGAAKGKTRRTLEAA